MDVPPRDPTRAPDHRLSSPRVGNAARAETLSCPKSSARRWSPPTCVTPVPDVSAPPVRQSESKMPRSFLVKNRHSRNSSKWKRGKLKSKREELRRDTNKDSLLHSTISSCQHCPVSKIQLQKAPKAISSSSCSHLLRTQRHLPFSLDTHTLSFMGDCYGTHRQSSAQSSAGLNLETQHAAGDSRRRESLQPPSVSLATLFPAVPSDCSSQERFKCLDCHNEHFSFMGLATHKQLECECSSKKHFSCKYCTKEYISLGALKMHIRTHTLPCVCKLCGKAFSRPWLLQGHIRTHTGEKPFSCFHCHRAFADRSNLRAHLQTHSELKKYQCACCLKTFSRISLLAKHQEAGCLLP